MACRTDRQARASAGLHRRRDPGLPDAAAALRAATAANDRNAGEPFGTGQSGLAGAGLQHPLPPPADPDRPHPLSPQHRRPPPLDRHRAGERHRFERTGEGCEGGRRWRVAGQKTRAAEAARLAQVSPRVEDGQKTVQWTVFPTTMRKRWKFGRSRSPAAGSATHPCFPTRSLAISPPAWSPQMGPVTHAPGPRRHPVPGSGLQANHERGGARGGGDHPAPQERQAVEGPHCRSGRAQRRACRSCRRLGRAVWKRWTLYQRRSLVDASPLMVCGQTIARQRMRCFKLFGERVMSVRHRPRTGGGAMPHLRQAGRRASDQSVRGLCRTSGVHPLTPQPLHRPRDATHAAHRIGLSRKGNPPAIRQFAQQSPPDRKLPLQTQRIQAHRDASRQK